MLGLVDDAPDQERLARSGKYHRALGLDYDGILSLLLRSDGEAAAEITAFHLAELRTS